MLRLYYNQIVSARVGLGFGESKARQQDSKQSIRYSLSDTIWFKLTASTRLRTSITECV